MSETRHEFVLTASDRTRAAFNSVTSSLGQLRQTALTATGVISTALGGVGVVAFTSEMAEMGESALLAADRLNSTTEVITSLQYAASKFGVDGESMNAILQDMSVRVQEFAQIGTGEAADFFETLSLDAKDFADLAPDQLLYRVAQELEGVSDASARVYLDQLGGDNLVSLLPVLRGNAEGLRELQQEAVDTNKVLSQVDAVRLGNIANEINIMQNASRTLSMQLAAEFEPTVRAISQRFNTFASDGNAVARTLDMISTSATYLGAIYAGKVVGSLAMSTQAKYAAIIESQKLAQQTLLEAEAGLKNAEQKLAIENKAYQQSIADKMAEAKAREEAKLATLREAQAAKAAAEQRVAAARQGTQIALLQTQSKKKAVAEMVAAETALASAHKQVTSAEKAYQGAVKYTSDTVQSATDNTKKLDRAKGDVAKATKALTVAQNGLNTSMRAGAVAARGLGAAMNFLGGPLGLLITGVSTMLLLQNQTSDTREEMDLLGLSAEKTSERLALSSYEQLKASLVQVTERAQAATEKITELRNQKAENPESFKGRSGNVKTKELQAAVDEHRALGELELSIRSQMENRELLATQANEKAITNIKNQQLQERIEAIKTASLTSEQALEAGYQKELKDLNDALASKLMSQSEYDMLSEQSFDRYNLKLEARNQATLQKQMSMFSTNYSERERLAQEHQQRVVQYAIDNNITNERDEAWLAFQKESYDFQLDAFKTYQDGLLQEYRDYGVEKSALEERQYQEEQDRLDKALRDKEISEEQHRMALGAAEKRHAESMENIKKAEMDEKLRAHKQGAGALVGMVESENKTLAGIGKAATIYNIGIKSYEDAMNSKAALSMIPIVGPALGWAAAAASIAFGVEQIANVNSQKYHTGGIAGYDADNFSQKLAQNEVPTVLMRGEEVLTEEDPRHRNNLRLSNGSSESLSEGANTYQITFGDINVNVPDTNATPQQIAQEISQNIGSMVLGVINTRQGQRAVYSAVGLEAGRNAGRIKGVR